MTASLLGFLQSSFLARPCNSIESEFLFKMKSETKGKQQGLMKSIHSHSVSNASSFFRFSRDCPEESHLFQTSVPILMTKRNEMMNQSHGFRDSLETAAGHSKALSFIPFFNERLKNGQIIKSASTIATWHPRMDCVREQPPKGNSLFVADSKDMKRETMWSENEEKSTAKEPKDQNERISLKFLDDPAEKEEKNQKDGKSKKIVVYRGLDQNITYEEPVFILKKVFPFVIGSLDNSSLASSFVLLFWKRLHCFPLISFRALNKP